MPDAALGALGIFFPQAPAFLAYPRRLQAPKGRHNVHPLFGVTTIPCDKHLRTLLDPIAPSHCDPVFVEVCTRRDPHHWCDRFRAFGAQLLGARDGTTSLASPALQCQNGLTRQLSHGHTRDAHAALTPVVVGPGRAPVLAFPPEDLRPQAGHDTQDCAQGAGKRWRRNPAAALAPHPVPLRGDALYSQQPCCALALDQGGNFLLGCTPAAHPQLDERLAFWPAHDGMVASASRHWQGRCTAGTRYRAVHAGLWLDGPEALAVNGCEIRVVTAKTGEHLSHQSCITHHRGTAERVAAVAQAGRGRWKSENEPHHVLKTKGSHVEHNCGHGKPYLAAVMRSLTLLACLFHTVVEWRDDQSAWLRRALARRQTFCDDIRAFTRYMVFGSWDHLMDFMLQGLELQPESDTS